MLNIARGWGFSTGANAAGKAFVERWIELFHHLTIDNYRVRHLNVRVGFEELRRVIQDAESRLIDHQNVQYVAQELLALLKSDPIAKTLLPHQEHYYPSLLDPFIGNGSKSVHPGLIVLVEEACETLASRYRIALIQALAEAIRRDEVPQALTLTSLLASDLIDDGYNFRHLLNRGFSFVREPCKAFGDRLQELLQEAQRDDVRSFLVAYRIDFATDQDAAECPNTVAGLHIRSQSTVSDDDPRLKGSIPGSNVRLATCKVEAPDLFAASRKGSTKFYRALDMLQFAKPSLQIVSHKVAYVASHAEVRQVEMPLELLGPIRIANEEVEKRTRQFNEIMTRLRDTATVHRVSLGLQYLRRGISDSAPQGQFLNYWIGLEAIAGGKERTDIRNIRTVVPSLLALGYPRNLMRDLYDNFERLKIPVGDVIGVNSTDLSNHLRGSEALWRGLLDSSQHANLLGLASCSPLLEMRLRQIADQFRTGLATKDAMEAHKREIEWHIQRLYRVRNAIVHGGQVPTDLTHLAANLATYLWAVLRSMLDDLSSGPETHDINKFFNKHLWLYERVLSQAQAQGASSPLFALHLEPTRIWPES
jgi:hypothetical protein